MKAIRSVLSVCLALTLLGGLSLPAAAEEGESAPYSIGIYTTGDMGGKCYDLDPLTEQEIPVNYLKVATAMAQERPTQNGTLLLDNGGLLQGTSIAQCNIDLEGGNGNPMALCLRYCGYDAFAFRSHEFRFATELSDAFTDVLTAAGSKYAGTPVSPICANEIDVPTQTQRREPYVIRSFQTPQGEYRVGILSFDSVERQNWEFPSDYNDVDFVHEGNTARSLAYEWTHYWQKTLREDEGCDFVVLMLPFGQEGSAEEDPLTRLVRSTTGINMVVTWEQDVPDAYTLKNGKDELVYVVNSGSVALTKTVLQIGKDGLARVVSNDWLDLSVYENDSGLKSLMRPYYRSAYTYVNQNLCAMGRGWDTTTTHYYTPDDTTNLLHEVQLWATGADLSILAPGMLEDVSMAQLWTGVPSYITLKDCYNLYKNGDYQLNVIEMTGRQIKDWLERSVSSYEVGEDGEVSGGDLGTDQIANLHYEIYAGDPVGSRVANITYEDRLITERQTFRVAVSSRRLEAGPEQDPYGWYAATQIGADSGKVLWDSGKSQRFGLSEGLCSYIFASYVQDQASQGRRILVGAPRGLWTLDGRKSAQVLVPVTRLELIERLYRQAGEPQGAAKAPFTDVGDLPAVNWAYEQGITKGNGSGQLLPGEIVTREQAMVMLFRYDQARGKVPKDGWQIGVTYTDAAMISVWSADALIWNEITGYLQPDAENYLRPNVQLMAGELETAIGKLEK